MRTSGSFGAPQAAHFDHHDARRAGGQNALREMEPRALERLLRAAARLPIDELGQLLLKLPLTVGDIAAFSPGIGPRFNPWNVSDLFLEVAGIIGPVALGRQIERASAAISPSQELTRVLRARLGAAGPTG